ncbi:ABC transporter ATP-binding protein [Candidatus Gracilibacteria bacterium]|nr:ABC transporter ATP-binding protein [Candidatus Gracilibacteria bacterium]MCF7898749.1 ABC transporter ATP-binding protein [Candidatus Paceibacterota bacterium]
MLKVNNLTKHFGNNKAVDDVSFEIKDGEIFSLIGPNSSGKTTIVKSIVGLLQPSNGNILIGEYDIAKNPEKAKAQIGYIPDEPSVWSYMTGEEFLYFTQALFGVSEKIRKDSLPKLLEKFSLNGLEKQYFEEYSRGNKQKFSILAATSHNPKLLLIDEPIVGLDPTGAEIAKKMFVDYARSGGSVLLVTHTLQVAQEISDRIGFLKNGKLLTVGTLSQLRQKADLGENASLEEVYRKLAS